MAGERSELISSGGPAPATGRAGPPRTPHRLIVTLVALTFASGLVDAVSFLGLGRVFAANQTGNVVILGFSLAGVGGISATAALTSLGAFALGAVIGGRVTRDARASTRALGLNLVVEVTLVLAALVAVAALDLGTDSTETSRLAVVALLAGAMGARSAAVRRLRVGDLSTIVLTMTLTAFAADSRLAGGSDLHAWRRGAAIAAMVLGAFVGGVCVRVDLVLALGVTVGFVAMTGLAFAILGEWDEAPTSPPPPG